MESPRSDSLATTPRPSVATSAGVLVGIAPAGMGIGLLVFVLLFLPTRYVAVGSIGAALAVMVFGWMAYRPNGILLPVVLTILCVVIVWRHRANIQRLIQGNENRIELGRRKPQNTEQC